VLDIPLDINTDGLGILGRLLVFKNARFGCGREEKNRAKGTSCLPGLVEAQETESLDLPCELGTREKIVTSLGARS